MIDVSNKQHGLFKGHLLAVVTLPCLSSRFGFPLDLCWLVLATQLSVWPRFDVHPHLARTVDAPVQCVATRGRLGFSHWSICLWAGEASIRRRGLMVDLQVPLLAVGALLQLLLFGEYIMASRCSSKSPMGA